MSLKTLSPLSVINSETLLPLGFIATLLGGVMWLTTIHGQGIQNAQAAVKIEAKQDAYAKEMQLLRTDIVEIKTQLKIFYEDYRSKKRP